MSSYRTHLYTCLDPACNRPFQCPNHLRRHWKQIHDNGKGGKFKCKKCPNTIGFKTQRYLTMHTAKKHAETEFEKQLILCPEHPCNEMFLKRLDLQRHVKNLHNKKLRMLLRLCKACFKNGDRLVFETEMDMLAHLEQCDSHVSTAENDSKCSQPNTSTLPCGYYPSSDAPVQKSVLMPAGSPETNGDNMRDWIPLSVPFSDPLCLTEPYKIGSPSLQSSFNGLTASPAGEINLLNEPSTHPVTDDWSFSALQYFFPESHSNMEGGYDENSLLPGPHISSNLLFQSYHNLREPQGPPVNNRNSSIWPRTGNCSYSIAPQYLSQSHTAFATKETMTAED